MSNSRVAYAALVLDLRHGHFLSLGISETSVQVEVFVNDLYDDARGILRSCYLTGNPVRLRLRNWDGSIWIDHEATIRASRECISDRAVHVRMVYEFDWVQPFRFRAAA